MMKLDEAVAKQIGNAEAGQPHMLEQAPRAARAVAHQHEAEQKQRRKERTPEDDGPIVADLEETGQGAASAPGNRRARNEQAANCDLRRALGGIRSSDRRQGDGRDTHARENAKLISAVKSGTRRGTVSFAACVVCYPIMLRIMRSMWIESLLLRQPERA